MSTELWSLINVNSKKCQRKLNNEHFVDDICIKFNYQKSQLYCDTCNFNDKINIKKHNLMNNSWLRKSKKIIWYTNRLCKWRMQFIYALFFKLYMQHFFIIIMFNEILKSLIIWKDYMINIILMRRVIKNAWSEINEYAKKILAVLKVDQMINEKHDEMKAIWKTKIKWKKNKLFVTSINSKKKSLKSEKCSESSRTII